MNWVWQVAEWCRFALYQFGGWLGEHWGLLLSILGPILGSISLFLQRRRKMPKLVFNPPVQGIAANRARNLWWLHIPIELPRQSKWINWTIKPRIEYCEARLYFENPHSHRSALDLRWQSENPRGDKYATLFYNREGRAIPLVVRCTNQPEWLLGNFVKLEPNDVFVTDFQLMFRGNKTVAARLDVGTIYIIRIEITTPDVQSWNPKQRYRLTIPEAGQDNDGMTLEPLSEQADEAE